MKAYEPTAGLAGDSAASNVLLPAFGMPTARKKELKSFTQELCNTSTAQSDKLDLKTEWTTTKC